MTSATGGDEGAAPLAGKQGHRVRPRHRPADRGAGRRGRDRRRHHPAAAARPGPSCWPPAAARSSRPVPGLAEARPGTTGRRPARRRSRGGCSCSAAAPSGPRWRRRSSGSAARRSWSWRARTGCSRARSRSPAQELQAAFEAEGITVVTGVRMTAARRLGRDGPVVAQVADGREFTGDEILVAVGRRPATADLGLEHVGLEPGQPVRGGPGAAGGRCSRRLAVRDRRLQRARSAHPHGQVPRPDRRRRDPGPGRGRRGLPRRGAPGDVHRPAGVRRRADRPRRRGPPGCRSPW